MEALWNLEDKWKLSTSQALILLSCTAAAFAGAALCAAAWFKKKKTLPSPKTSCGWVSVKRVLVGSVRWSKPNKWETPAPLLSRAGEGFQSHSSTSPVWQRPILMGEKCELPKYSGVILYDETGRLLHDRSYKEEAAIVVKTRLKDLL